MKTLVLTVAAALVLGVSSKAATPRPNIVVILSDDMGFSDIGCYGSEIATPNLDALAAKGVRFTQFYNTARCCPTRASLLTGLYPHQAGVGHMTDDRGYDGYRGDLNRNCVTIAEALRPAGYRNYAGGKWHVTKALAAKTEADKHNWPLQRGFDRFYGTIIGGGSYWDPAFLTRDNTQVSAFADAEYQPSEPFYYTDAITDHAVRFVRDHKAAHADAPFFLYVAYTAAHWPMHARERDIAKYKGRYAAGYDAIRRERYERMVQLGLVAKDATVALPVPGGEMGGPHWEWDQRNMEVYAAMVDAMDQGIGRLVAELKANGQFDNTLICFLQDNGACAEPVGRGKDGMPRADRPTLPPQPATELRNALTPKQTRDGFPVRQGKGVMAGGPDTYVAYGEAWATVSNTPFREYKHWVHEGGISTPLIVHWPRGVAAEREGKLDATPGHLIDVMATCVDVSGATYPTESGGTKIKAMQGRSFAPRLSASPGKAAPRLLYWEHEGNRAVRDGGWKLVAKENQPWELYDIAADRSEQHNLAAAQPERVKELAAKWDAYAAASDVLPLGAWRAERKKAVRNQAGVIDLAADANIAGDEAPGFIGRAVTFTADVAAQGDGVIVAQGGSAHGWALYLREGRLCFAAAQNSQRTEIRSEEKLDASDAKVRVEFTPAGAVTVSLNDLVVAKGQLPRVFSKQPADGLQVGQDLNGTVGSYTAPFTLEGTVRNARLELR